MLSAITYFGAAATARGIGGITEAGMRCLYSGWAWHSQRLLCAIFCENRKQKMP